MLCMSLHVILQTLQHPQPYLCRYAAVAQCAAAPSPPCHAAARPQLRSQCLQETPAWLQQQLAARLQARGVGEQRSDVLIGVWLAWHERDSALDKYLQQQRPAGGLAGRQVQDSSSTCWRCHK
jgi:hypothetical protein